MVETRRAASGLAVMAAARKGKSSLLENGKSDSSPSGAGKGHAASMSRATTSGATSKRRQTKARKRKQDPPPPVDDTLYEIRAILDERRVRGKIQYLIDWLPHPQTGEIYQPTWEPAGNVNEAAIAHWEETKGAGDDSGEGDSSDSDTQAAQPSISNKRKHSGPPGNPPSKRAKQTSTGDEPTASSSGAGDWAFFNTVPDNGKAVAVVITPLPDLDPSEYQTVPASQSTDEQEEGKKISQTTIPDSQESTDSLPPQISATSALEESQSNLPASPSVQITGGVDPEEGSSSANRSSAIQQETLQVEPREGTPAETSTSAQALQESEPRSGHTSENIPSRQIDQAFREDQSTNIFEGLDNLVEGSHSSPLFLTQPSIDLPLPTSAEDTEPRSPLSSPEGEPRSGDNLRDVVIPATDSAPSSHPTAPSQAAQVVPNTRQNTQDPIRTQSPESQSAGSDKVSETAQKATRVGPGLEEANQAPSEFRSGLSTDNLPSDYNGSLQPDIARPSSPPQQPRVGSLTGSSSPFSSPVTPQRAGMGNSPMDPFASDARQQLQAAIFGDGLSTDATQSLASESLESHTSLLQQTLTDEPLSAVEQLKRGLGLSLSSDESTPLSISPASLVVQPLPDLEYQTVAPSDLTTSTSHVLAATMGLSLPNSLEASHMADVRLETGNASEFPPNGSEDEKRNTQTTFIVTLPMAASGRDRYLRLINEEKDAMIEFGEVFTTSTTRIPPVPLVAKIDSIFQQLFDICDLPAYAGDVHGRLNVEGKMRHATNTNSKYLFVHEFLDKIRDLNGRILLLCSPGTIFDYLEAVVSANGFQHFVLGRDEKLEMANDGLTVLLADTEQDLSVIHGGVDVVVSFDRAARAVELPNSLSYDDELPIIVLSLVIMHTLEHIEMDLDSYHCGLGDIEKRGALNLATAITKKHLKAPDGAYPEPHEAAEIFANVLLNPTDGIEWEHQPLPSETFDLYFNSQSQLDIGDSLGEFPRFEDSTSRKRPSDDTVDGFSKRARLLEVEIRQPRGGVSFFEMSELLKTTLAKYTNTSHDSRQINVNLGQLEAITSRLAQLEDAIVRRNATELGLKKLAQSLEAELCSHKRTGQRLEQKFAEALHDRSTYEKQYKDAEKRATEAEKKVNDFVTGPRKLLDEQIDKLKSQLGEARDALSNSANPDVVKWVQTEKDLADARAKIQSLEKKTTVLQKETEYSRSAYQDASNRFGELNQENSALKTKITELERRANDNIVKIHEINTRAQLEMDGRQYDELRALIQEREREIGILRDENRHLKNNRRETRGSSVPRSPRTAMMMSPQPRRGGFTAGTTPSRGTSPAPVSDGSTPVPGMTYLPPGNGRWGHLRD